MTAVDGANPSKLDPFDLAAQLGAWSEGRGPLYRQLAAALADLLADGAIRSGTTLPPERRLADRLSVSRGTVVNAYGQLEQQGWIRRVQGRGTIVTGPARAQVDGSVAPPDGVGHRLFMPSLHSIDLLVAVPAALPEALDICEQTLIPRTPDICDNAEPAGIDPLRHRIAEWYRASGLPTNPEQIVVTSGAQQAIALAVEAVIQPGDVVLVESFTWPGLLDIVRANGGRVHAVPMDDHGVIVEEFATMVERLRPRMVALNPHNHNPTGSRLPASRRDAVADLCARYGVAVIEDRVASLLNFDHQVPPPLAAGRPEAAHVTIDSLNKLTWPGLRLGWIRTDTPTVAKLRAAKALNDLYSSIPSQLMALRIMEKLDELTDARRTMMVERSNTLVEAVARRLPDWEFRRPQGGVVLWVGLPGGRAAAFARIARSHGVSVATSAEFAAHSDPDDHIRLPFTQSPEVLAIAVERLARAWEAFRAEGSSIFAQPAPSII
ncbi:MAG: PLP-dependent aminotransferase family protein [Acidimicrobiia bacterium]|nr:PLP-dependent aminotransferase family protein [Acidimicrobiia bacterium]